MQIWNHIKNYPYPITTILAALALWTNFIFYTTPTPANVISYTDHILYALPSNITISLTIIAFALESVIRMIGL